MLKNLLKFALLLLAGALGGALAVKYLPNFNNFSQSVQESPAPVFLTEEKTVYIQENVAIEQSIQKVKNSTVALKTITPKKETLEGSGLILTSDGLFITLAELVPWGSNFNFFVEGQKVHFQLLKRDLNQNLALVKLEKNNLSPVGFFDLEKLKLGQRVFILAQVFSPKESSPSLFANQGIIRCYNQDFLQTNIQENKKTIGSPVFDIKGDTLGISYLDKDGFLSIIPISIIKNFAGL